MQLLILFGVFSVFSMLLSFLKFACILGNTDFTARRIANRGYTAIVNTLVRLSVTGNI